MVRLGRYFKAPPQRATRQWLKIELLHHFGEGFESGNSGLGIKCHTLPDTVAYLCDRGLSMAEVRAALQTIRSVRSRPARHAQPDAAADGGMGSLIEGQCSSGPRRC